MRDAARMGAILKNVLLTGLLVILTTVVASSVGGMLMLIIGSLPDEMPSDFNLAMFGVTIMALLAAVFGVFFSMITLFIAALTMPPVLLVTDRFKLPRPAMDMIGGGLAGLWCAMIAIGIFSSDKFAGMVAGENAQIMAATGAIIGCLAGYVRHALLVRPALTSAHYA